MSKNIVVFSDCTGQEGGKDHNSNVYKLFNMVVDRSSRHVAFYDRGLGTGWRKVSIYIFIPLNNKTNNQGQAFNLKFIIDEIIFL